ncbi:zinc piracy TonB-dependent receptor ZnuD [soil metagenome]
MRLVSTLTIILYFSLSALGQSGGTVSGKITYARDVALHGVSVQIVQTRQTAATDDNGNYQITNVPAGRYTILVHQEGFSDATRIIDVTAGSSLTADFRLDIVSLQEQVTVTASGTEQSVFDAFQSVNSVGSTRIIERASTSIGEVLEHETGVAKRSFGPGTARPVIRGFDGDRVLVLQDGVRSGSLGSQSGDHGEPIDPLSAERIEVVKGPGTLLYGSNAIGGVVNVINNDENDAHEGFRGFLTGVGGTANRQGGFATGMEYGVDKVVFRGNFSTQRTGDYKTPIGRIDNSASWSRSGSFGVGYYGDKSWISGTFSSDVRRYGIPFAGLLHGDEDDHDDDEDQEDDHDEDEHAADVDLRSRTNNFKIAGGFRNLTGSFLSGLQYNVSLTKYRHTEIEIEDGVEEIGTIFDNRTFSYRMLFEQQRKGRLTGRFGFEGLNRDYEVVGEEQLITGAVKHNSFSFFALEELNFERVKFQFGGRVENNRYDPVNPDLRDRGFTGFSGGAGINVGLWRGGAFIANYTHSNRAPALEELYNNGPHIGNVTFEIGNENLVRETANGIDLSLRHQSDRFRMRGNVYYYGIRNFVFLAPQDEDGDGDVDIEDGLPVAAFEQADARYYGAELNLNYDFTRHVGGFFGVDMVRARLADGNINLPRIPPARARFGLDFRYGGLSVRPEVVVAASQERIFPLETRTDGYGLFNIGGSYTIGRQHVAHIFTFNAYNLTNKLYRNHLSFIKELAPEIGRGIRVGYTIRFF